MGGIAEQEDVAITPSVRDLRAEGVLGDPHQLEVVIGYVVDPWRYQAAKPSADGRPNAPHGLLALGDQA